jgi:hypothetical protein
VPKSFSKNNGENTDHHKKSDEKYDAGDAAYEFDHCSVLSTKCFLGLAKPLLGFSFGLIGLSAPLDILVAGNIAPSLLCGALNVFGLAFLAIVVHVAFLSSPLP